MATFNEPGHGRKQCPSCKLYCGTRSNSCPGCSHNFKKASAPAPTSSAGSSVAPTNESPVQVTILTTPAGKPPVELTGTDEETVWAWARGCTAGESRFYYTVEALLYWARSVYSIHSAEWRTVRHHLLAWDRLYRSGAV